MSDKLENITGSGIPITIKGKEYKLGVFGVKDFADFRQHLKGQRVKVLQECIADREERIELITAIMEGNVNEQKELSSMDGVSFMLWRSLQKYQPEITLEDSDKLVDLDNVGEIFHIIMNLGGQAKNPPKRTKIKKK